MNDPKQIKKFLRQVGMMLSTVPLPDRKQLVTYLLTRAFPECAVAYCVQFETGVEYSSNLSPAETAALFADTAKHARNLEN